MEKARKFWNKSASQFEKNDNPDSPARQETYAHIRRYLNSEQEVLDFGCATGSLCIKFSPEVKTIHGIDISDKMIAIAQKKIASKQISNVKFTVGAITSPSIKNEKFDVILAFYVLHLVATPSETIMHLSQQLKPGGIILIEVPCLKEQKGFKAWFTRTFSKFFGLPHLQHFKYDSIKKIAQSLEINCLESIIIKQPIARNFIVLQK